MNESLSKGTITAEQAKEFKWKHIVTKAMGADLSLHPTVNYLEINPYDLFLICSDGLTDYVKEEEIGKVLGEDSTLEEKSSILIKMAQSVGSKDDITVMLIQCE